MMVNVCMFVAVFARGQDVIPPGRELRELLQEGHDGPYTLIIVRDTPRGHATHLHSVFDNPERFGWVIEYHFG